MSIKLGSLQVSWQAECPANRMAQQKNKQAIGVVPLEYSAKVAERES